MTLKLKALNKNLIVKDTQKRDKDDVMEVVTFSFGDGVFGVSLGDRLLIKPDAGFRFAYLNGSFRRISVDDIIAITEHD